MNKTKIDWADYTWNPVTGCYHDCPYCYARKIATRFAGDVRMNMADSRCVGDKENGLLELVQPFESGQTHLAFPFGFLPTLHHYRLNVLDELKNGQNIFVCSMADLFGEWVPDRWIELVFATCKEHSLHNYLFLTKNPKRYAQLAAAERLPRQSNMWYGSTVTGPEQGYFYDVGYNTFLSIEPILGEQRFIQNTVALPKWVIIGAETGNRSGKVIPRREWIDDILSYCKEFDIPVFLKNSLKDMYGENLIQEWPKELMDRKMGLAKKGKLIGRCFLCGKEQMKNQMQNLRSRKGRGTPTENFGYLCDGCYQIMKNAIENNKKIGVYDDENR